MAPPHIPGEQKWVGVIGFSSTCNLRTLTHKQRKKQENTFAAFHSHQGTTAQLASGPYTVSNQGIFLSLSASSICHWGMPLCAWPWPCGWALVRLLWVLRPKAMEIGGVEDLGTRALMADREQRETDAGEISMSSWIFHSLRPPVW